MFCGAIGGAGIGFLWFNTHPAQVFMGDVGALALGGALGFVALATKTELSLPIIGGLFIVELMSDIIQVGYYKRTKRRVFLMAPIHHHFEKKGWPESRIVVRFWIVSFCFAIAGLLLTLKVTCDGGDAAWAKHWKASGCWWWGWDARASPRPSCAPGWGRG